MPRIWTPALVDLVPESRTPLGLTVRATSWGYEVIDFARDYLEIELMPWQRWLLIHMLELEYDDEDPDAAPMLRFEKAVVLVARQNGKSTLSQVLALWFMVLAKWPVVLGTAQDLPTAEAIWAGAVALLKEDPELADLVANVRETNSQKTLVLETGEIYIVKAANRRAGRGLSGNFIMLDELREQTNWASWSAITKTTQAQDLSLILCLSNAGDITSVVLRYLRLAAHRALGDPDGILQEEASAAGPTVIDVDPESELNEQEIEDALDDLDADEATLFLAEWSARPERRIRDRAGWVEANPALGHRIQERKLAGQMDEPEWVIRTEVLCQWPDAALSGPFPPGTWEAGQNKPGKDPATGRPFVLPEDRIVGPIDLGVDQTNDRGMASVVAAGTRPDGEPQVVLIANRPGTDWIRGFLHDHPDRHRFRRIAGQSRGAPITPWLTDLETAPLEHADHDPIEVVAWAGADLMNGFAWLFDDVRDKKLHHHISGPLDMAASTAETKRLQDGMVIDRATSPSDPSPLVASAAARWLARQPATFIPAPPPPPVAVSDTDTPAPTTRSTGGGSSDVTTMSF